MEDQAAFIKLSLLEGTFEIRGSEEFVSSQAERFETLIHELMEVRPQALEKGAGQKPPASNPSSGAQDGGPGEVYPHVFARSGDTYQITTGVPGSNNAAKTANIGLLLGLAHNMGDGEGADKKHVIQACKSHSCFDSPNFKTTLKDRNQWFLLEGTAQNYRVTLTHSGKVAARKLAGDLEEAARANL